MNIGDLVTYGPWFLDNVWSEGKRPYGIILDKRHDSGKTVLVMWPHTTSPVWELEDDMVVAHESR